jgi:hypothetical protein
MSENDRKYGANTDGRGVEGKFASGNSGKPKGARHRVTRAAEVLLEGQSEAITQKAVDKALEGDTTALRLCLERLVPARKDAPIQFDLPPINDASEAAQAAQSVLQAVSEGSISPLEGAAVMGLVESYRRTLELTEFEQRLKDLEEKL